MLIILLHNCTEKCFKKIIGRGDEGDQKHRCGDILGKPLQLFNYVHMFSIKKVVFITAMINHVFISFSAVQK